MRIGDAVLRRLNSGGFSMKDLKKLYDSRWVGLERSLLIAEVDDWRDDGENIFDESNLAAVRHQLENVGCIVVVHWHYRGASAPTRLIFEDYEDFCEYLVGKTKPGDAVDVHAFPQEAKPMAKGKCPDPKGRVPKSAPY
jgi:hypothetical protein